MKTTQYKNNDARRVLTAMVTDATVCARIASKWPQGGLFGSRYENLIGHWCVRHMVKYGKPLGREIESVFDHWATNEGSGQETTIDLIEKMLSHLSDEYERGDHSLASDYVLDLAGKLFRRVEMERVKEAVEIELEKGDVDKAWERWTNLTNIELGVGSMVRLGEDYDAWRDAFDDSQMKPLIMYPGALGRFIGNEMARDSFVAFMGSSKRGKTFWLHDLAYRAVRAHRRVVHFDAGDLSQRQAMRRFGQRALRRPKRDEACMVPIAYEHHEKEPVVEERKLKRATPQECFRAWEKVVRKKDRIRLSCHPNSTLSMAMVVSLLQDWAREEWTPDVIVIDYADLLAAPAGGMDRRDGINENWKQMRRISQEYHCLVVTATQADAESYSRPLLSRRNFSEDRRKHDHVTAMLGINVLDEDKKRGISRLNWLDRRDNEYTEGGQVWVAGCLAIGMPVIKSTF